MGRVVYEVPLITQAQNPICQVCCMAMIASERRGYSVGAADFTGGWDPSNSSIPDPSSANWDQYYRLLRRHGFGTAALNPSAAEIESLLASKGPILFTHYCNGFPYGAGWPAMTSGTHAVVITGIDSGINGGQAWMNNPWGNKDRPILSSALVTAITAWLPTGQFQVAYWDA